MQDVLYRSAKQDRTRRFHALYDKVARSDILARAFGEVRANHGAPGVDDQSIDDIVKSGVESFLDDIARALKDRTYRPQPLRRVEIPKAEPGKVRVLGIPTCRDRVIMTAAKMILEPIWEADLLPAASGTGLVGRAMTPWRRHGSRPTGAPTGLSRPTSRMRSAVSITTP